MDDILFKVDGSMGVPVKHGEGSSQTLNTKFVLACDGKNSVVLKKLQEASSRGGQEKSHVHSPREFAESRLINPSVGKMIRCVMMDEQMLDKLDIPFRTGSQPIIRLNGAAVKPNLFQVTFHPMNPKDKELCGGFLATQAPGSPLWQLTSTEHSISSKKTFHKLIFVLAKREKTCKITWTVGF